MTVIVFALGSSMRGVGVIVLGVAAAVVAGGESRVAAADLGYERQDPDLYLMFSGVDVWRAGGFLNGGFIYSPLGLDRSGFLVKVFSGTGAYRYRSQATTIVGVESVVAAMPGWRFKTAALEVSIFGGPDSQVHVTVPDDPAHPLRGLHIGFRGGVDLWWEPGPDRMLSTSLSFASSGPDVWARVATGWKVTDWFYAGPEAIATATTDYRQLRLGLHATAVKFGPYEWSVGIGWARDTDTSSGVYGRCDFLVRR